ncbi:MAG: hypothetical protein O3A51_03565, partial [Verrucomicrobia bacterium]|nr:hypothetical protein [Verrucomicrobiota bacterium]
MRGQTALSVNAAAQLGLIIGLLATGAVSLRIHTAAETRIKEHFASSIEAYAAAVNDELGEDVTVLLALKALFDSSAFVSRGAFKPFASFLLASRPSIQAVGRVPRVPPMARL